MRIGFISPRYPPSVVGGGEISVQLLAETLAEEHWVKDVRVFTIDGDSTEHKNGVTIHRIADIDVGTKEMANLKSLLHFYKHVDEIKELDLIHSYNMKLHPLTGYLSKTYDIPSVATLNSYEFIRQKLSAQYKGQIKSAYRYISLHTLKSATLSWKNDIDTHVALSKSVKSIYVDDGFPMNKITVIPNMIDPSLVDDVSKPSTNSTTLLYAGALKKSKGVRYLIKSLVHLPDEISLRVAGTGDQLDEIQKLVEKHGLGDRVEFVGWLDHEEMSGFYDSGDIFVHPAVWPEPFGRTLLEAMQHRLPIVATWTGGTPEVIPQSELLCRTESPASLAIAIQHARENVVQYGDENRTLANSTFHPKTVIPEYRSVYESLI